MSLLFQALVLRLYAGQHTMAPQRSIRLRIAGMAGGLALLAWLAYRLTPHPYVHYDSGVAAGMIAASSCFGVAVLYLLAAPAQRLCRERLAVIHHLPVSQSQFRRGYWLLYAPLITVTFSIMLPVQAAFFGGSLRPWLLYPIGVGGIMVSNTLLILLLTTDSRLRAWAGWTATAMALAALGLTWQLANPQVSDGPFAQIAAGLVGAQVLLGIYLSKHPPQRLLSRRVGRVREHSHLGMTGALLIRALRTKRYSGANGILAGLLAGMTILAYKRPQVLAFDGVLAVGLLLAATFGQEARALSARRPLELRRYGLVARWLLSTWVVAFLNAALFTSLLLGARLLLFPHSALPGYDSIMYISACLTATACCAGSIVVPQKYDMLAQMLSTALYGGLAWGVFRMLRGAGPLGLTAGGIFIACLVSAAAAETWRWRWSIRRKRGMYAP